MKKFFCIINFISIFFVFAEAKLIPFSKENKIGFVDENLNIIIDPKYDSINKYNGNSFVMYLKQTQINVLVNENGIRNVQNILLLGDEKYSIYMEPDTFVYDKTGKRIRFLRNLQHDHNSSSKYIIVFNGKSENIIKENNEYIFMDNKILELFAYDEKTETALCRYSGKGYSLIDAKGIKNNDSYIFGIRSFDEGLVFGKNLKTGECGFYNMDCRLIIKTDILDSSDMDDWYSFPAINCGVIGLVNDGKRFIFLCNGQTYHSDNWCIINKENTIIAKGISADYVYPFYDDVAVVMTKIGKKMKYTLINKKGILITNEEYDEINSSINGYCMAVKDGLDYLISSKDGSIYNCNSFTFGKKQSE